jgi:LAO/AO transport system kinase
VETVGLGQSELEVQQCVDMLILTVPPGGGDSLQGVKKGIVEIADAIIVTKADGNLLAAARHTAADYRGAMQFLNVVTDDEEGMCKKSTSVMLVSSVTGDGLEKLWKHICDFRREIAGNGRLTDKRKKQSQYWMWKNLQTLLNDKVKQDPALSKIAKHVNEELDAGNIPPRVAASILLSSLERKHD